MLWLLHKLSEWMNRSYDFTDELERLREKQRKRIDIEDDGGA